MPKLPPPPVIEGTLKEPIYAMSFGILVSMWSMNIGSLLTPHYFAYIVSTVVAFECVLWFMEKPRKYYEVYKPPTRESGSQETPASSPARETGGDDGAKTKKVRTPGETSEGKEEKGGKESRFRFRHKKNNDSLGSPVR
jgi:hypothetical protein